LGIPVVAILDSNCNPDEIDYPIPGNDDASRAIELYCDLVSKAVISGIEKSARGTGIDLGAVAAPMVEPALDDTPAETVDIAPEAVAETVSENTDEATA